VILILKVIIKNCIIHINLLQLLLQEVDEDDERALEMFMNHKPAPRRTLADIILEKITQKQTELQTQFSDAGSECFSIFCS
jgi:hypothetical protein